MRAALKKTVIWILVFLLSAGAFPTVARAAEKGDKANSFRYENGRPITESSRNSEDSEASLSAESESDYPNAWKKVDGKYLNSEGQEIEGATAKGIDVSHHQGTIDWAKVKADGVEFAIIRCGYGMDEESQDDSQWENNIKGCEENGISYGVYLYSYADTVARAQSEAEHVLRLVEQCSSSYLQYPVYYDMEDDSILNNTTAEERGEIAAAFISKIKAAGYQTGVYASKDWFENYLPASVFDQWNRWVAHWADSCGYTGTYQMWQATSTGAVDGIDGNVDIDFVINKTTASETTGTTSEKEDTTAAQTTSSTSKEGETKKTSTLKTPSIKVKKAGKKKVKLTWKPKTSGVKCYIYYSRKKKSGYKKYAVVSAKKGKIIIKKLKSKKKYYFKVRLGKKYNGRMIYSKYSAVRAVKVK